MDPNNVTEKISDKTKLIVPVHVFGNTCSIEQFESLAQQYNLKTVNDASHAFAVNHREKSITITTMLALSAYMQPSFFTQSKVHSSDLSKKQIMKGLKKLSISDWIKTNRLPVWVLTQK